MMKTLIFMGKEFKAEKIVKTEENIIGKDVKGREVFSFKGIKDFSLFTLKDSAEYDTEENLIDQLILDNINMQMQIDSLIQAQLGGN